MKSEKTRKFIRAISIALIIGGLSYAGKELYSSLNSKSKIEKDQNISKNIAYEVGLDKEKMEKEKEIKAANEYIGKLRQQYANDDIIGRLEFKKLGLDFVLVHSHNNQEYLDWGLNKQSSYTGSIFLDKDNKDDFSDFNSRIFGHRMLDGTVFGGFRYFLDQGFADKNKEDNFFKLTTKKGIKMYDIVSILDITDNSDNVPLKAEEKFLDNINNHSVVKINRTGKEVDVNDNIVCLISCKPMGVSPHSTRRIVIVGRERK